MIGRTLAGRYRIVELIGGGGFSDVYLARDIDTNGVVAVKVLHPHMERDQELVRRFVREAELAQQLVEPHIVRIFDAGEDSGTHFLVMEYVQGHTLDQVVKRRGRLPIPEVEEIGLQALEALQVAHSAGIVHRDIKPQNLMLTNEGVLKVMDFGIARQDTGVTMTRTGMYLGTPQYMSPEQATGERVGHLSDLYALSITLYELLVGHPPFVSETPWKTLDLQLRAPPPPIRQVRADVPVELEDVILRALEKSPGDRFQSAREMHEALARAAGVNGTVILSPGPGQATTRLGVTGPAGPNRRRLIPWLVIAGLAAAVVLVLAFELGGNGGGTVGSASPTSVPRPPTAPPEATTVASGPVVAATGVPTSLPNPTIAPSNPTVGPLSATAVLPTPTPSSGQQLDAARALLDQQRYPEAIAAMNAIRDSDPSTPGLDDALYQAHMGYSGKLLAQEDVEGSYAEYSAALKLRPNDQAALNGQQQVILLKHWHEMQACWGKDDDCTLTALEQIYAVNPDYRQTREKLYAQLIAKADRLLAAGDRAGAYTVLMHALDVNPNGAEAADRLVSYTPTPVPAPEYVAPAQQSSGGSTSSGAGTGGASGGGYRGSSAGSSSGGGASSGGGGGAPPPARPLRP